MCGFVLSYISGAAGVQLSTSSAPRSRPVSTATKHKVCFGACVAAGERPLPQCVPSHMQAFCLEQTLFTGFIVPVGQGEQIPPAVLIIIVW